MTTGGGAAGWPPGVRTRDDVQIRTCAGHEV
ncbi:hypothetical protein HNR06_002651 [Nocardiopsis arvandica]|uniref:Uncharacterized protein n=1 Tax=Nocardiopsis sinuspersici TaxID=501010 RepID=A0A7Y9XC33_9ACTN|nr:hypothetical protein [Nocardiopsis sinuspersici]